MNFLRAGDAGTGLAILHFHTRSLSKGYSSTIFGSTIFQHSGYDEWADWRVSRVRADCYAEFVSLPFTQSIPTSSLLSSHS